MLWRFALGFNEGTRGAASLPRANARWAARNRRRGKCMASHPVSKPDPLGPDWRGCTWPFQPGFRRFSGDDRRNPFANEFRDFEPASVSSPEQPSPKERRKQERLSRRDNDPASEETNAATKAAGPVDSRRIQRSPARDRDVRGDSRRAGGNSVSGTTSHAEGRPTKAADGEVIFGWPLHVSRAARQRSGREAAPRVPSNKSQDSFQDLSNVVALRACC
jgi:hypothetical protein